MEPSVITRVTEHIPEIISYINEIFRNGHAYELDVVLREQNVAEPELQHEHHGLAEALARPAVGHRLAQARGGSVSVATDPLKIHILQFVKPIRLPRSAEADVKTVRLKLSGERTLVRLPTPSAPLKRAAVAEANPYCKAFKVRERGASASTASASTSA